MSKKYSLNPVFQRKTKSWRNAGKAIAAYLSHLETERHLSPHTVSGYRQDLNKLLEFFK